MSNVIISQRWLARGGTSADLATVNETPLARELILETDTGRIKRGDGTTAYNDLPYINTGEIDFSGIAGGNSVVWDAANTRFKVAAISADAVEYTAGSGSVIAADNVGDALDEVSAELQDLDDEKLGDAPSDGNTYGRKNGAWAVSGGGGGGGGMTLLGTATVAGSAATTLTLSSLDLSAYKAFKIIFSLKNATASNATISLYYNADTTAANYYNQNITGNATLTGSRANNGLICSLTASEVSVGEIVIVADLNGRPRARSQTNIGAPASIILQDFAHIRNNTANVTEIILSSSVANSFDIGSTFSAFGVN